MSKNNELDNLLPHLRPCLGSGTWDAILEKRRTNPALKYLEEVGLEPRSLLGQGDFKHRLEKPKTDWLRDPPGTVYTRQLPSGGWSTLPPANPIPPNNPFG